MQKEKSLHETAYSCCLPLVIRQYGTDGKLSRKNRKRQGADIFCALFVSEKSAYTRKSPAGVLNRNFWRKTGSRRRGGNRICL